VFKNWLKQFILYASIITIVFVSINYICDPYGIFNINWYGNTVRNHIASDRMTKVYYAKRLMPQTVLIGSSRAGTIDTQDITLYTHDTVYNLALGGSSLYEQAMYAKFAIEVLHVKHIIWGIDFFSLNPERYPDHAFEQNRLSASPYMEDYKGALLSLNAFLDSLQTFFESIKKSSKENMNLLTGSDTYHEFEKSFHKQGISFINDKIEKGLQGYAKTKTLLNSKLFQEPHSIDKNLETIKSTLEFANLHNVQITIYISPVYYKHLELIDSIGLLQTNQYFKTALRSITPYWDFNTKNSITTNINNFWDNSHARKEIGQHMMKTILTHSRDEENDFGLYYSKQIKSDDANASH